VYHKNKISTYKRTFTDVFTPSLSTYIQSIITVVGRVSCICGGKSCKHIYKNKYIYKKNYVTDVAGHISVRDICFLCKTLVNQGHWTLNPLVTVYIYIYIYMYMCVYVLCFISVQMSPKHKSSPTILYINFPLFFLLGLQKIMTRVYIYIYLTIWQTPVNINYDQSVQ